VLVVRAAVRVITGFSSRNKVVEVTGADPGMLDVLLLRER